jgi:pilus assembly protein CpaB
VAVEADSKIVTLLSVDRRLAKGAELRPEHLVPMEWPRSAVPKGAFDRPEAIFGEGLRDRRHLIASIEPGELILQSRLSKPNECGSIGCDVPPGMRLISVPIGAVNGVSGFIGPGDHVDILLTREVEGQLATSVILEGIQVRAIDQNRDDERGPRVGRTATVLVSIRDAQIITLALQSGSLSLVLRGSGEELGGDPVPVDPVTPEDLNDLLQAPKPQEKGIWINRGGERIWVPLP